MDFNLLIDRFLLLYLIFFSLAKAKMFFSLIRWLKPTAMKPTAMKPTEFEGFTSTLPFPKFRTLEIVYKNNKPTQNVKFLRGFCVFVYLIISPIFIGILFLTGSATLSRASS